MKKLGSKGMKVLKTVHLITIMMWTVGVITMAIIALLNTTSGDELYMKFKIIRLVDGCLVIPGATAAVLTGVVYGVWTGWGFFKYYWVTVKWIIGVLIVIVGTFVLSPWLDQNLETADTLREGALTNADFLHNSQLILICGCSFSILLLILIVISVFKPWKRKTKGKSSTKP